MIMILPGFPVDKLTVQDRCGQCNELSLVCIIISANKRIFMRCFFIGRYKIAGKEEEMESERKLLSVDEFCNYVGIGKTKAREMLANPCCKYAVRIGRRVFVHKELFDEELKKNAKYQLVM